MKIIQVNGWGGRLNGPLNRFVSREAPDIICLQEAFQPVGEDLHPFRDQYRFLEQLQAAGDLPHVYFAPSWGFEMAGALVNVGNAILSRFALSDQRHFHVNNNYFVAKRASDYKRNTRTVQSATINIDAARKLTVANHHGYLAGENSGGDETSLLVMQKVAGFLAELSRPLIFCGDLNVAPNTPTLAALGGLGLSNLTVEYNLPTTLSQAHRAPESDRNSVPCDYVYVSEDVEVKSFGASDEIISDHKALFLEFEI